MGVKNLVVQPTHLMHGSEYDEMMEVLEAYEDQFESVAVAEPMLGEVGDDASVINEDKKAVAQAVADAAVKDAGYESISDLHTLFFALYRIWLFDNAPAVHAHNLSLFVLSYPAYIEAYKLGT